MNRTPRIYFDVTFSSSVNVNVGITRTVRRLLAEFEALAPGNGFVCVPVVFNAKGFRELQHEQADSACNTVIAPRWRLTKVLRSLVVSLRKVPSKVSPFWVQWLSWSLFCGWNFNRLSRGLPEINAERGDVLFLSDACWSYRVWKAARLASEAGATVVTVVYDLIPLRHPEFSTRLNTVALKTWLKQLLPRSDAVMCISRAVEEDLRNYAHDAQIRLATVGSFRLGCDHVAAGAAPGSVRQAILDFVSTGPCFSAIGSIEPRKNHAVLLDAFDRLWDQGIEVGLIIIGGRNSKCRDLLDRIGSHQQLGKRLLVVFDGNDEEVAFAYKNSRALLLPSAAEGFGLPLVEARAHGCRVIASDLRVFKELADEGVSMFSLNFPQKLDKLILSHLPLVKPAPPIKLFTWEDCALQCFALFRQLASAARKQ